MILDNHPGAAMPEQPSQPQPDRGLAIPDGGLAANGLPEWMQSRPEWATRQPAEKVTVVTPREIPAPDTSTIDLSVVLATDDLPDWLQQVARRPVSDANKAEEAILPAEAPQRSAPTLEGLVVSNDKELVPQPWWASDRVMAGLLIAVALTVLFVLVTTIRSS